MNNMVIYLIALILLAIIGMKVFPKGYNKDYISKENTAAIKGIFILIVFLSHLLSYLALSNSMVDSIPKKFTSLLGQLMVAPFLFYSGYGVYESIKNKGYSYVKSFPRHRILGTMLNFVLVVTIFFAIWIAFGKEITIKKVILAFIGWDSFGNSNWYIFTIIILYILTYFSFMLFKDNQKKAITTLCITSVVYCVIMSFVKEDWWFNTALAYPFGVIFSHNRTFIESKIKHTKKYLVAFAVSTILFIITHFILKKTHSNWAIYEAYSILFSFIVVLISFKINLTNPILRWLGDNLFWIYILQRIPMNILSWTGAIKNNYLFAFISLVSTILLALIATKILSFFNKKPAKH